MKELYTALLEFQKKAPQVLRDTQGYGYKYPRLEQVIEVTRPILNQVGLVVFQSYELVDGQNCIKTTLAHAGTGQTIVSVTPVRQNVSLKGMNDFQVDGSAISYYRRYALLSLLFLAAEDNDAQGEQETKPISNALPESKNNRKITYAIEELDVDDMQKARLQLIEFAAKLFNQKKITEERYEKIVEYIKNAGWPSDLEKANISLGRIYEQCN